MRVKLCFVFALLLVCVSAVAQHDHSQEAKKPQMDPKMMEAMMAAGTPGAPHKMLDGMAGTWNTKMTWWMMPGADPMSGEGLAENKWIMGGRYMEQRFTGTFSGMPFEGLGFTGYDNIKKQYWGTWMDNMGTGMMLSTGKANADGTMTFDATYPDPMTGKDVKYEEKIKVIDADHTIFEMWAPGPDGKMFKQMEIHYTRKK
ncbi:MAG TPA: DUF1579 domain-containing protein [Thermoanaerobaculia bacterium]|nr:DUF1579 domain-containing protein [Thermoanaerobaculia bacterium]